MRHVRKPKYRIDKLRINLPKEGDVDAKKIYEEMLRDKIRKSKRR